MGNMIGIHQQGGVIDAYVSVPGTPTYHGGIIVIHEVWGLTEQIKRVADKLATQGYYALAPDLYSSNQANRRPSEELERQLFSPNEHERFDAMPKLRALIAPTQTPQFSVLVNSRLESCFEYLYAQPLLHQKVAAVGFGTGGTYAMNLAMHESRLLAAVSFYASAPLHAVELRHIQCPILAFYGEQEQQLVKQARQLEQRMRLAGINFQAVYYKEAGHAFFNDSNAYSYNQNAAEDAWQRTLRFVRNITG